MKRATLQNVNKERFAFMFASLVGRKVTVKLRNLTSYEGVFTGCNLDKGEYTVLLQFAHELPSENRLSGPVQDQMLIPGKEVVMMNAIDVPEEGLEAKLIDDRAGEFKTDVDISTKQRFSSRGERHLQSWADLQEDGSNDVDLDSHSGGWSNPNDQFTVAKQMGVVSTYKEELYTTPLDYSRLSTEQRARAEKLAREIEGGRNYSSQEEGADDADEEARFSAVIGTGGYKKGSQAGRPSPPAHPSNTASSWRRMDEDSTARSGANTRLNALNLEPASARLVHESPAPKPKPPAAPLPQIPQRPTTPSAPTIVSEMKGINALNLEPASVSRPAVGAAGYRGSSARQPAQPTKRDFEIALAEIKSREQRQSSGGSTTPPPTEKTIPGKGKGKGVITTSPTSKSAAAAAAASAAASSKFSFNPNASTFTPGGATAAPVGAGGNTLSIAITPGGSLSGTLKSANYDYYEGAPAGGAPPPSAAAPAATGGAPQPPPPMAPMHPGMMGPPPMMMFPPPHHMPGAQFGMMVPPPPQPMGPPPMFTPLVESAHMDKMTVSDLMVKFIEKTASTPSSSSSFEWSSETGPSYKEILGPIPQGGPPHPMMAPPMMAPPMMPQPMMVAPGYGMPGPYPPYYPPRGSRGGPPPGGQFMPQYPGGYMAVPPPHGGGYRGGHFRGQGSQQGSTATPSQNASTPQEQ